MSRRESCAAQAVALAAIAADQTAYAALREEIILPADPLALFASLPAPRTLLWDGAAWLLGCGQATEVCADGPGRGSLLVAAQARIAALSTGRPVFFTAWSFEDASPGPGHWGHHLPGARLWLPQRAWQRLADGHGAMISATKVSATDDLAAVTARLAAPLTGQKLFRPSPWQALTGDYRVEVEDAATLIRDGAFKKVVLARAIDEIIPAGTDVATVLARLRALVPDGTVYAHDLDDGSIFIGVTPELLFAANGLHLETLALAGSAPDDQAGGMAGLMDSTKQRKEHGLVVEHLVQVLRGRCRPFAVPTAPLAQRRGGLLHLESRLSAELLAQDHLGLIAALHPTPAVCGLPSPAAAHYLARHEHLHRGLYAGVLGWLADDACRCVVPLRGGILRDGHARLFAGAGIVETSDADDELAETEWKLAVMRRALRG